MYIYSDPIHSGKTTRLEKWIKKTPGVDGILTLVRNDKRFLKFISGDELHPLETDSNDPECFQQIGKYKFRTDVFAKAQNYLLGLIDMNPAWIVIDEIGFLELDGCGFEPAVSRLIHDLDSAKDVNILLVVRNSLKEKVMNCFKLNLNTVRDYIPE